MYPAPLVSGDWDKLHFLDDLISVIQSDYWTSSIYIFIFMDISMADPEHQLVRRVNIFMKTQ